MVDAQQNSAPRPDQAAEESHSTFQLAGIVLRVRDDIDVLVREHGGQPTYIIEDALSSRYYRIGAAEYTFLSLLDGKNTFAAALGKTAALMKAEALTEDRAASFAKWLVESGLASTAHSRLVTRLVQHNEQGQQQRKAGQLSVLSQRFPLFHPKKSIDRLERLFGWLLSGPIAVVWLFLVGTAALTLWVRWEDFGSSASQIVSRDNWIWLAATWLMLKVVHEAAHAVACRHYGGTVREAGALLIVFIPLPYVDVTSAWRFASKWQRLVTSAAGMMAELAIAAIAVLVWHQSGPGLVSQNAVNIVFSAGLMTLLFNANPLMRFDGYYMLIDALELPNLYTHGSQAIRQLGRRFGLGLSAKNYEYPEGRQRLILVYGIAALVWRVVICVGLVLAADAMFLGLGTLLAIAAVTLWLIVPVFNLGRFVAVGNDFDQPSRPRFVGLVGGGSLLVGLVFLFVPWYSTTSAPLVIDYYPRLEVRSRVSGFVDQVKVKPGQKVVAGQALFLLRNDDLQTQIIELRLDIDISEQRAASYLEKQEVAAFQVEQNTLAALKTRVEELQGQRDSLLVKAPADGIVLSPSVQDLDGSYVSAGSLVVMIGPMQDKKLLAMVDQSQSDMFRDRVGQLVHVHLTGTGSLWQQSRLIEVSTKATRDFPHPALAASAGGPLTVRVRNAEANQADAEQMQYELVQPHFLVRAELPTTMQTSSAAGQPGTISFVSQDGTVGSHLRRVASEWWSRRQQAIQKQIYKR